MDDRRVRREEHLREAIISRCHAEGVIRLSDVRECVRPCVSGNMLIELADQMISDGRITEADLIPLPESRRPSGPNPYSVVEYARKTLPYLPEPLRKNLANSLSIFDASEREFREELDKHWERKPTSLSVKVIRK